MKLFILKGVVMTKYHVNPETGRANICRAKVMCDFAVNGVEPPHYDNKADAKDGAEKMLSEEYGGSFGQENKKVVNESSKISYTEPLDLQGGQIRAGDVVFGEKFVNGKWKEDSAVVQKVETEIDLNLREKVKVTYENGNEAVFTGNGPVQIKKPAGYIEGKDPKILMKETKDIYKKTRNNTLTDEDVEKVIENLNDSNANEGIKAYSKRISSYLEDENDHDAAIRIDAAEERIRLSYDSNAKIDRHFALMYDNKTPDSLFQKAAAEKPETLEKVKDMYELSNKKWTRNL